MADYDVYDHRDIQASCMDLDAYGQKLVLAGKKCVAILNAADPEKAGAKFHRRNKFDITCVKFCPHNDNRPQIIAASSQFYEIYNVQHSGVQMLANGKAHSRNVTDLDWDHFNSYQFATCSVDDSVNVWDVRDCKRPSQTFNIIAGAFQVKWCRRLEYIFATAHEGDIRLWDTRKNTSPIQFIAAHLSKVLSLDWHATNEACFVSSSLDKTVKIFDFMKPNEPEVTFATPGPVWKAKFAPFDDAVLTSPFPQVGRIEHAVLLWTVSSIAAGMPSPSSSLSNNKGPSSIVHSFTGHSDLVLDFCTRKTTTTSSAAAASQDAADSSAVQLYTLSKDNALRLWTIDARMRSLCSFKSNASRNLFSGVSFVPSDSVLADQHDFNFGTFVDSLDRSLPPPTTSAVISSSGGDRTIGENQLAQHSLINNVVAQPPSSFGGDQLLTKSVRISIKGGERPSSAADNSADKASLTPSSSFTVRRMDGSKIDWDKEMDALPNCTIPNITVEEINRDKQLIFTSVSCRPYRLVRIVISPAKVDPQLDASSYRIEGRQIRFQFMHEAYGFSGLVSGGSKMRMLKVLQEACQRPFSADESVIEVCLRRLSNCLEQCLSESDGSDSATQPSAASPGAANFGELVTIVNSRVPFPATCGARFCATGFLVCFARKSRLSSPAVVNPSSAHPSVVSAAPPLGALVDGGGANVWLPPRTTTTTAPRSYGDMLLLAKERREAEQLEQQKQQQRSADAGSSFVVQPAGGYFDGAPCNVPRGGTTDPYSLIDFYYPNKQWMTTRKKPRVDVTTGLHYALDKTGCVDDDDSWSNLHVYDCSRLFPYNKEAAKLFKLSVGDVTTTCSYNANVANQLGRKDLVKLWRLIEKCAERCTAKDRSEFETPWALTPFGRKLISQLADHYCRCGDFQTAALMCTVLGSKVGPQPATVRHTTTTAATADRLRSSGGQPVANNLASPNSAAALNSEPSLGNVSTYNTIHSTYGHQIKETFAGYQRHRSNSFTDEAESALSHLSDLDSLTPISENGTGPSAAISIAPVKTISKPASIVPEKVAGLLDPEFSGRFQVIQLAYADLLHRWGLLNQRAEILQYSSLKQEKHRGLEYRTLCQNCGAEFISPACAQCKSRVTLSCVLCKLPARGLTSFCSVCCHGGHTRHLLDWFKEHSRCPSGCGCTCSYT